MAQKKTEAWLTSAVTDDSAESALVLAASIRRSGMTRIIAVITSGNVAERYRIALNKSFDAVFCMDGTTGLPSNGDLDTRAKLFAFSLRFFAKCVFVSPYSLFLENTDALFDDCDDKNRSILRTNSDDAEHVNLCMFMFAPCGNLWENVLQSASVGNKSCEDILLDILMDKRVNKILSLDIVSNFSVSHAELKTYDKANTHAAIIQFIDMDTSAGFPEQMKSILKSCPALREQLIIRNWLESYEKITLPTIQTGMSTPCTPNLHGNYKNDPIAIIGMSCRYPGANNLEEFWKLLYDGEEGIREPPAYRWSKDRILRGSSEERRTNAGFLSQRIDEFDEKFFGVSPKEAVYMDPQTRLLHEVLWESLEDGGIDPQSLYGTHAGIFTGSWMNDYRDMVQESEERDFFRTYMGNSMGSAAARLSFLLGLTGPSVATESGCSSSIVALDLAVKSLRVGETNLAMVGGVNLLLHPFTSGIMEFVVSPDGRCKTFDSKANGFGRAEGCGVLVLKRLSDALRDRDNIWAVIRGCGISQEGPSRSMGTPTVQCEALAMKLALEDANVSPEHVSVVEAHGTGTAVGDPMEMASITKAYHTPNRTRPLVIGSVKTNVGHTESCSGITGIMKTVLAMNHELIPKHRNFVSLNPEIFLENIPAIIPLEHVPWPKVQGQPRIAGVSSFGITGTDGHVIIEEAPDYSLPKFQLSLERSKHILKISAKSKEALKQLLEKYANLFSEQAGKSNPHDDHFRNMCYSGNVGRASFNHRAFLVASNYSEAVAVLKENRFIQAEVNSNGGASKICFIFTGQGSQYPGMAKLLYETSPVFRVNFDNCDRKLQQLYGVSIKEAIWESDAKSKQLCRTIFSQTAIFCVEYCLLKLWQSWGIHPDYVLGHSLGEFCAAVAAKILDWEDALKLVAERSRLIEYLPTGSMLVVRADEQEVQNLQKHAKVYLDIAAVNSSEQTVVAGDTKEVEAFQSYLNAQGKKAIILEATHAFHSKHMDPILEEYRIVVETVKFKKGNGKTEYVSGMEGRLITDLSEVNADYWVRHTREQVSFLDACAAIQETGCDNFLEIGPQPVLSSFVAINNEGKDTNIFPSLRRGADDWNTLLNSLGRLYLAGYNVDWKGFDEPYDRKKVSLPHYPFNRKPFWVTQREQLNFGKIVHPLLGSRIDNASSLSIFENSFALKSVPFVKDHCIGSRIVYPGACYTEMFLAAGCLAANGISIDESVAFTGRPVVLENLKFDAPLELWEERNCRLQVVVDLPESSQEESGNSGYRLKIYHQNNCNDELGKWVLHSSSNFKPVASVKNAMSRWNPERITEIISQSRPLNPAAFYKTVADAGMKFGPSFKMINKYWAVKQMDCAMDVDEVVVELEIPSDRGNYILHPLAIDAVFQAVFLTTFAYTEHKLNVPVKIGKFTLLKGIENGTVGSEVTKCFVHASLVNGKSCAFISSQDFTPAAFVEDIQLVETNVRSVEAVLEQQISSIPEAWQEVWKPISGPFNSFAEAVDAEHILTADQFQERLLNLQRTPPEDFDLREKTNRLLYLYILSALIELGWDPKVGEEITVDSTCKQLGISLKFRQLIRFYFSILPEVKYIEDETTAVGAVWKVMAGPRQKAEIIKQINELSAILKETKVAAVIAIDEYISKHLANILTGKESPLSILFPSDKDKEQFSADAYYQKHPATPFIMDTFEAVCKPIFQEAYNLNYHESSRILRVLEVGSGTGSLTKNLLKWLTETWATRFELYFTDLSASFFVNSECRFKEFGRNIKYAIFNIEESPLGQGIPLNYFDMVVAADVLHATRSLEKSLLNLRHTLRPGGVLCFRETVIPAIDITFVFGLLEGYWRYEDFQWRKHHCCAGVEVWEQLVARCGFGSCQSFKSYVDQFACIAAVASPVVPMDILLPVNANVNKRKPRWVVFTRESNLKVSRVLANSLDANGNHVTIAVLNDVTNSLADYGNSDYISSANVAWRTIRGDLEDPTEIEAVLEEGVQGIIYAVGMDESVIDQDKISLPFLHITKALIRQRDPGQLYVLTHGVHAITDEYITTNPTSSTILGMAKSLKNEYSHLTVRCVDVEGDSDIVTIANQLLYEIASSKDLKERDRVIVSYREGQRFEPRLIKATGLAQTDSLQIPIATDRYHLILPETRVIQDLRFDIMEEENIAPKEIEIQVKAFALNFRDIFAILKPSAQFEKINSVGLDFSGIVTKVGSRASQLKIGDRVFGANISKEAQLPSHLLLDEDILLKIPDNMTFWEAATIPTVFATAYHCLITVAKMRKGDKVLIHTGSGGVGLAAIQLAKHVGAKIITTAGSKRKRSYLKSLGISHVFHSRDTRYENEIMEITNGLGVDIVLNSITGPGFKEATLNACAKNARFVEMSKLSTWTNEDVKALRPDIQYDIVDLTGMDQLEWIKLLDKMREYILKGTLKPIPYVKFDALNIRQALQYFQKAKHIGKVVCTMPQALNEAGQWKTEIKQFNSESTYMITGGLGGIGFEVCKWMLELGAKDIVLTGRNAPKPEIAKEIEALNEKGANVKVKLCDVGNSENCRKIIEEMIGTGNPLRGVMHCAGVLQDNLYANQTWSSFQATFTPKVKGTWNLHKLTENFPLEHFVVFSSVTALVGTPAQANHVAANSLEDAFIHYRHSLGLPGTTINWGQWAQVGCAKEVHLSGILPVSVKRMLNGLEIALRSQTRQVSFCEFESFANLTLLCPTLKNYLDDTILKQEERGMSATQNLGTCKVDNFWTEMETKETRNDKLHVITEYLKVILRNALRLHPEEAMSDHANIQELGVDSLMMIELKNSIQSLMGSKVNVTAGILKDSNTVLNLADTLMDKLENRKSHETAEKSEQPLLTQELLQLVHGDSVLPPEINTTAPGIIPAVMPSKIRTILVTGATGQLAPYIISEIFKSPEKSIQKIICVLRRGTKKESIPAMEKLKSYFSSLHLGDHWDCSKIDCIGGDVTEENLGLEPESYKDLCANVDALIHCAGKTNYHETYTGCIRDANVGGILNILRFACTGKIKHIYYPSTFTAAYLMGMETGKLSEDWPDDRVIETLVNNNVSDLHISKSICESLLKQANERGIPAKVFRFPWISGATNSGRVDYKKNECSNHFLDFVKVNALPLVNMPVNCLPVDTCAELSMKIFFSDETPFEVFNIGQPQPEMLPIFTHMLQDIVGRELEMVKWQEFTMRLQDSGASDGNLMAHRARNMRHFADAWEQMIGSGVTKQNFFESGKLSKYIPGYEKGMKSSIEITKTSFLFLKDAGVLAELGII